MCGCNGGNPVRVSQANNNFRAGMDIHTAAKIRKGKAVVKSTNARNTIKINFTPKKD